MTEYPAQREADAPLRDGSTIRVRPIRSTDRDEVRDFYERLSPESRVFRFMSGGVDLGRVADWAVDVDYRDRYGLIATRGSDDRIVGHGSYARAGGPRAEVAFAVADELRGRGVATVLLAHLAEVAEEGGIATFEAEVMPTNHRMVEVFRESGFPVETSSAPGAIHLEFPTSFSADAQERFYRRDRAAAAAAVRAFMEPRSVAVIGASRRRGTVGGEIFHNLVDGGFNGVVYPVNPTADVVQSVRAYRSLADVPEAVDLAVIAVPSEAVGGVARECADAGVAALVVISAGFGETGDAGMERQRELVEICRGAGMRLVGPNCLGVLNTNQDVALNATFAPTAPPPGNVGFLTQSGALGLAMIGLAADRNLGLSSFASIGNRADVTGNDLLEYWEDDAATRVALLYIESFSDARRFGRVARRVGARKPIVVVKSGRSQAGARATSSHTGALLAASDITVDALFKQAGVIRSDSLADMLDVASLLANQPLPAGPRVGILTNAGGPGIMCADACEAAGLEVPALPDEVQAALRGFLAPEASVSNPVDMIATATAEDYRRAIAALGRCESLDAMIVVFVRPLLTRAEDVAREVHRALGELPREIAVQTVFMSAEDHAAMVAAGGVPCYLYPEDAARALSRARRYASWRQGAVEPPEPLDDVRHDEATALIAEALEAAPGWLGFERLIRLLDCYGIPVAEWRLAGDPAAAGDAAAELGGPVALKALGPQIVHKTDLGAIETGLDGARDVAGSASLMDSALARAGLARERFLVQRMVEGGAEMIVGVVGDEMFGPVVACGAGGVQAEILKDVSVRIAPLTRRDAGEMVRSLATYPLLTGYRGSPPVDIDGLVDVVLRVGAMVEAHHEIAELDLNPVVAAPDGCLVVDARVRVEAAIPQRPWPSAYAGAGG